MLHFRSCGHVCSYRSERQKAGDWPWPSSVFEDPCVEMRSVDAGWQLRCAVRRKWVALEPEEWVQAARCGGVGVVRLDAWMADFENGVGAPGAVWTGGRPGGRGSHLTATDTWHLAVEVKAPQGGVGCSGSPTRSSRYDLAFGVHVGLMITNGLQVQRFGYEDARGGMRRQVRYWPLPAEE